MRNLLLAVMLLALVTPAPVAADSYPHEPNPVVATIKQRQPRIKKCYDKAREASPGIYGKVVVELHFAGGKLDKVEIVENKTGDQGLADCMVKVLSAPWPSKVEDGTYQMPFVFGDPAALTQSTVKATDVKPYQLPGGVGQAKVLLAHGSVGATKASLTLVTLDKGGLPMAKSTAAQLIVPLDGTLRVIGQGQGQGVEVWPGDAVYVAAGVPVQVKRGDKAKKASYLLLIAPAGAEQAFAGDAEAAKATTVVKTDKKNKQRPAGTAWPLLARGAKLAELSVAGGKGHVKILFDAAAAGDGAAYVGLVRFDAGAAVPEHVHTDEAEILYVLSGSGTMTIAGQPQAVEPGMAIHVPPRTKHAFTTTDGIQAVQFYAPSGPEQRFKAQPAPAPSK